MRMQISLSVGVDRTTSDDDLLANQLAAVFNWTVDPSSTNRTTFKREAAQFPDEWRPTKELTLYRGMTDRSLLSDDGSLRLQDRTFSSWTSDRYYAVRRAESGDGFVIKMKIKPEHVLVSVAQAMKTKGLVRLLKNSKAVSDAWTSDLPLWISAAKSRKEFIVLDHPYTHFPASAITLLG